MDSNDRNPPAGDRQEPAVSLPAPLVPADCNLQGMVYMPLDVQRLRDSTLAAEYSADECWHAVLLWAAAWQQVPAGSLPNSDTSLAKLAGFGTTKLKAWRKVKAGALHGFVLCSDNRLYHPVVCEKALEAWEARGEHTAAKEADRDRKKREREWRSVAFEVLRRLGIVPDFNTITRDLRRMVKDAGMSIVPDDDGVLRVTRHADDSGQDTAKNGTERIGEERNGSDRRDKGVKKKAARAVDDESGNSGNGNSQGSAAAQALVAALAAVGVDADAHDPDIRRAESEGITPLQLAAATKHRPNKPLAFYVARAIGQRDDAANRGQGSGSAQPAPPQVDPAERERRERIAAIENEIIEARHLCDVLGLIDVEQRDLTITRLKAIHADLTAEASA